MLDLSRVISRAALGIAFLIAITMPIFAFHVRGPDQPETWAMAAAALAVVTSIISAWSTRRVLELHEDAQRPNPYPSFDLHSRYQVALLRIKNAGGTAAYDVKLEWDTPLRNDDDEPIGFPKEHSHSITILLPGESIAQWIGVHHKFIQSHPVGPYTGMINFRDSSKRLYRQQFKIDGRPYAGTPSYDDEVKKMQYELQQIPKELRSINSVMNNILNRYIDRQK